MTAGAALLPLAARALLHSVWQGGVAAAALAVFQGAARRASSRARYTAAWAALLLLPAGFIASLLGLRYGAFWKPAAALAGPAVSVAADWLARLAQLPPVLLVGAWLGGVAAVGLYSLGGWLTVRRLLRRLQPAAAPVRALWSDSLHAMARRLDVTRRVELGFSDSISGPCAWGWLRPMVLVPVSWAAGMSPAQVEAILAHELAHIARADFLANGAQRCLETIFFYHPAAWWISRQVRHEREHCCDELAARAGGDACGYARALLDLELRRTAAWAMPLALPATGGSLRRRVLRLLRTPAAGARAPRPVLAAAAALALAGLLLTVPLPVLHGSVRYRPARRAAKPPVEALARRLPAALPRLRREAVRRVAVPPMPAPASLIVSLGLPAAPAPWRTVGRPMVRVSLIQVFAPGCAEPRILIEKHVAMPLPDGSGMVDQDFQTLAPCGVTPQEVLRMLTL